ncbi:hypothetical protein [Rhizobium sp. LjRoot254]|uniref:hypothetical protein n=1 Tax=Rhizobium sp. LjRoot254 TaxID=3342297 RepID=UPI003ECCFBDE
MDIYSLTTIHIHIAMRPARMSAWAEDHYYSNHMGVRLGSGLLGSIALAAGVTMMLGITLI